MVSNDCLKAILDKSYETMSPRQLLSQSPTALAGISEGDAQKLKEAFGIRTIEDLAESKYFQWAQAIRTLASTEK
jgi:predicted RecB family nuclease